MIKTTLIDATNVDYMLPKVLDEVSKASFVGLDCETHDDDRHEGLMDFCGYDPKTRKKPNSKPTVFDIRRTTMTGFSIYVDGSDVAYYFNLAHADVEDTLKDIVVRKVVEALPENAYWISHNAPFEITMFAMCHGIRLERIICTLQMAVSAYGPDEYEPAHLRALGNPFYKLVPDIIRESASYVHGAEMSEELSDLMMRIVAKESKSSWSYNGVIDNISFGYGLKKCVKSWFGVEMTTYEEVLGNKAHMGQLTGDEVAEYGADDAYWAVRLFHHLLAYMINHGGPELIQTFFDQENPMTQVFADIWMGGLRIKSEEVFQRRKDERSNFAKVARKMKAAISGLLPFENEQNERLLQVEKWYANGADKYRKAITAWAKTPDLADDYEEALRIAGPVSNAWAIDTGAAKPTGPNFSHYMPVRMLMYDLFGEKVIFSDGKVQSDGDARGRLKTRIEKRLKKEPNEVDKLKIQVLDCLTEISGIEQRMKLYLTPYSKLMDPETGKLYSVVSSMLATRRMAARFPNPMQLGKRGESTYVRGFYQGDNDDHLVVSIDWSGIELVEIGEFSGDPEFIKAFGQIPHEDLHSGAAADILSVDVEGLTETIFKDMRNFKKQEDFMSKYSFLDNAGRLFTNLKGEHLDISKAMKYWRTEVGKGANFNYWYSGFLGTVGERMGWDTQTTGHATERYRDRFSVAEKWRTDLIEEVRENGFITLPDHHRRVRFEATMEWREIFNNIWNMPGVNRDALGGYYSFANEVASRIQKRSFNQAVNAYIQGSCATIAKRSILRIIKACKDRGWGSDMVRFMMPIHDELVFSVHWSIAPEFIVMARGIMIDHPDMFTKCQLDASPSIGRTFVPFSDKTPYGQIELYEAPKLSCVPANKIGGRLTQDEMAGVVDYLRRAA